MNLIPEQRLDRNGKLVTRHIKSLAPTTDSSSALATSSITAPKSRITKAKLYDFARKIFMSQDCDNDPRLSDDPETDMYDGAALDGLVSYLKEYPKDQLRDIIALSHNQPQSFLEISEKLYFHEPPSFVKTFLTVTGSLNCENDDKTAIARSIHISEVKRRKAGLSDGSTETEIIGLARVLEAIVISDENEFDHTSYLTWVPHEYDYGENPTLADDLVEFIINHDTRINQIIDTGNSRKTFNLDVLRDVIDHSNQSLAEGTL